MRKPVLYAQFDVQEFMRSHTYKPGYFSYQSDGFGPIAYDYETILRELLKMINSGCKLSKLYSDRIDDFFHIIDKNNSARTYKAIVDSKK
jgi:hypothetical protein